MPQPAVPNISLKTMVKKEIGNLSKKHLLVIYKSIKALQVASEFEYDTIQDKLNTFVCKSSTTDKERISLRKLFQTHWKDIFEGKKITTALIKYFEDSCSYSPHLVFSIRMPTADSDTILKINLQIYFKFFWTPIQLL